MTLLAQILVVDPKYRLTIEEIHAELQDIRNILAPSPEHEELIQYIPRGVSPVKK